MKRSRIFLGITTAMLAIAGVAAARMHNYGVKYRTYFTDKSANHVCTSYILTACTKNATGAQCDFNYTLPSGVIKTYLLYTNPSCNVIAPYRQG